MKLFLNKNEFVNNLLGPVSKLSDNLLLDFVRENENNFKAKTLVTSSDNSIILLGDVTCKAQEPFRCVIPDCKTFLRLFSGIEEDSITLSIATNAIEYKESTFSFKYHLLDESYIVNKKSISEEKLNSISFDTSFSLTKQKLSEIIKFNSIVPDAEKLYFYTEGSKVFAKLGDQQKANTNEIVTEISSSFDGPNLSEPFPINIQNILLFSFNEQNIKVSVNHELKVFKFETANLKYIVSGLVK
jgi:hypothetical protein